MTSIKSQSEPPTKKDNATCDCSITNKEPVCAQGSKEDSIQDYLVDTIVPTLPPTVVVVAGFFIFHKLAIRRQKHVEIFETFRDLKALINDINDVAAIAWRSRGNDAAQDGTAAEVRQKLTRAREDLRLLYALDEKFSVVRDSLNEFRTATDEDVDDEGNHISTIDDIRRSPNPGWVLSGIAPKANALRSRLNDTFAAIYGPGMSMSI